MPVERALARVKLGAIEHNAARLRSQLAGAELCAVVKADGYGHGAAQAARAALAGGATWIAVATAAEAAKLRDAGIDARLLVMGALTSADLQQALAADADIGVWTHEMLAAAEGARVHVKFDSGMGRLGTKDPDEARALCEKAAASGQLTAIWTHFATADETGDGYFPEQLSQFATLADEIKESHPGTIAHAA